MKTIQTKPDMKKDILLMSIPVIGFYKSLYIILDGFFLPADHWSHDGNNGLIPAFTVIYQIGIGCLWSYINNNFLAI